MTLSAVLLWGTTIGAQDELTWNFRRGDVDANQVVNLGDVFEFLNYVFFAQAPAVDCDKAYDFDGNGVLNVVDPITMLEYQFGQGATIPAPFQTCGLDETGLTCNLYPICEPDGVPPISAEVLEEMTVVGHVLRRVAHGQTPDLFDSVMESENTVLDYIDEQLSPDLIDESGNTALNDALASLNPDESLVDLRRMQIHRAVHSERQLVEVMTDFWDNHFNTEYAKLAAHFENVTTSGGSSVYTAEEAAELAANFEWVENEGFRANALGSFEDLLMVSAQNVAMTIYLDSVFNDVADANENYAREVMELHTLGVDVLYTQTDIEILAKLFTGWTICLVEEADAGDPFALCQAITTNPEADGHVWTFTFDPDKHDYTEKVIFEGTAFEYTVPAGVEGDAVGGLQEGLDFLSYLAGLDQTAEYVCTKLVQKFVDDENPPAALISDCLVTWILTDGDIAEVLDTLFTSDEFLGADYRLNKVRTPMEYLVATVRGFEGELSNNASAILGPLETLGHLPHAFPTPDGYPESGHDQLSTGKVLERMKFTSQLFEETTSLDFPNLVDLMTDRGVDATDADYVVQFWVSRLFGNLVNEVDADLANDFLSTNDIGEEQPLQPWANLFNIRIGKFLSFLTLFPQYLMQ